MEKKQETLINEIKDHLVRAYHPLAIYLFGSYAWGTPDKYSDIDFFIIVEKSEFDSAERIRIGLRELKDIHADIDLLVFTSAEIAAKYNHPSTLTYKVMTKGVKLYEAA